MGNCMKDIIEGVDKFGKVDTLYITQEKDSNLYVLITNFTEQNEKTMDSFLS